MASDTEDAKKAASLVQEATRNYEKASEEFGAARQDSSEAQVEKRIPFRIRIHVQGLANLAHIQPARHETTGSGGA